MSEDQYKMVVQEQDRIGKNIIELWKHQWQMIVVGDAILGATFVLLDQEKYRHIKEMFDVDDYHIRAIIAVMALSIFSEILYLSVEMERCRGYKRTLEKLINEHIDAHIDARILMWESFIIAGSKDTAKGPNTMIWVYGFALALLFCSSAANIIWQDIIGHHWSGTKIFLIFIITIGFCFVLVYSIRHFLEARKAFDKTFKETFIQRDIHSKRH